MCWRRDTLDLVSAAALRCEIAVHLELLSDGSGDLRAAAVIVGELVANAVRHAPGPMCIAIDWRNREPILVIIDSGPGFDVTPTLPPASHESGRGLYIVCALAKRFVAERIPSGGMRICATLPVQRSVDAPLRFDGCPLQEQIEVGWLCPWPALTQEALCSAHAK